MELNWTENEHHRKYKKNKQKIDKKKFSSNKTGCYYWMEEKRKSEKTTNKNNFHQFSNPTTFYAAKLNARFWNTHQHFWITRVEFLIDFLSKWTNRYQKKKIWEKKGEEKKQMLIMEMW